MHPVLRFSERVACLPVVHGSGDFAVEVRRAMLAERFDCLAVPLPPSFEEPVRRGISFLPQITIALQQESPSYSAGEWDGGEEAGESSPQASYVPIDPCQPVISALRLAQQERIRWEFVDLEVERFESRGEVLPDPYALKQVSVEQFAAAVLPASPPPRAGQRRDRLRHMARRLRELESRHKSILLVCSVADWAWIRDAFVSEEFSAPDDEPADGVELFRVEPKTLIFLLGELPPITGFYEQARATLEDDENLSVDGVKLALLLAREKYREQLGKRGRPVTPQLLRLYLKYVRNLSLVERRLTPDMYTLVTGAQQIFGDQFAVSLAEVLREYPYQAELPLDTFQVSFGRGQLPDGGLVDLKNRLPGPPQVWRTLSIQNRPPDLDKQRWQMRWNPFAHCSWPPEDVSIERFRTHVKDRALSLLGNDLARIEKFTTSLKDGLDIRETLRNWHTGELYVKENPPSRGSLDCVLMLFDSPADPREYPWRITWHAEHHDESTLSFFATHFSQDLVGPGIAQATYGGALFLFPPRPVRDIWRDRRFDFVDTLEERLLAAGCVYARERHIAVLSQSPPGIGWRRLAKRYGKKLVHVPLSHFSQASIQQLRMFHVLNGKEVRSYAEHFIRKA